MSSRARLVSRRVFSLQPTASLRLPVLGLRHHLCHHQHRHLQHHHQSHRCRCHHQKHHQSSVSFRWWTTRAFPALMANVMTVAQVWCVMAVLTLAHSCDLSSVRPVLSTWKRCRALSLTCSYHRTWMHGRSIQVPQSLSAPPVALPTSTLTVTTSSAACQWADSSSVSISLDAPLPPLVLPPSQPSR